MGIVNYIGKRAPCFCLLFTPVGIEGRGLFHRRPHHSCFSVPHHNPSMQEGEEREKKKKWWPCHAGKRAIEISARSGRFLSPRPGAKGESSGTPLPNRATAYGTVLVWTRPSLTGVTCCSEHQLFTPLLNQASAKALTTVQPPSGRDVLLFSLYLHPLCTPPRPSLEPLFLPSHSHFCTAYKEASLKLIKKLFQLAEGSRGRFQVVCFIQHEAGRLTTKMNHFAQW